MPSTARPPLPELVLRLAGMLQARGAMMCSAESCTGGLIAAACTDVAGSSLWFERGFVSYSNAAKTEMLGVDPDLIYRHGSVSEEVVRAMARGAIARSQAKVSVAVTGVAGPAGGSPEKPVGTVWFGWQVDGRVHCALQQFSGDRAAVRAATVRHALEQLMALLEAGRQPMAHALKPG